MVLQVYTTASLNRQIYGEFGENTQTPFWLEGVFQQMECFLYSVDTHAALVSLLYLLGNLLQIHAVLHRNARGLLNAVVYRKYICLFVIWLQ